MDPRHRPSRLPFLSLLALALSMAPVARASPARLRAEISSPPFVIRTITLLHGALAPARPPAPVQRDVHPGGPAVPVAPAPIPFPASAASAV